MTPTSELPTPPAKHPYAAPALIVHGNVQALTLGKTGTDLDLDSIGSLVCSGDV